MSPSVGVVTVTHNSEAVLAPFLDSVRAELEASDLVDAWSLVVADNASAHASALHDVAVERGALFLERHENDGYGAGVSAAVEALPSDTDFVLISNPDVVLHAGSLDALVACALRTPEGASFGPRILDLEGAVYPSARNLPSLRSGVGHAVLGRAWPGNPWSRAYKADRLSDRERTAGWLSGACLLVRRDRWDEVGGFDHGFFMYFEDVDLGARLGRAGWKNVYVPSATVVHTGAHSTSQSSAAMERVHHQSAYRYLSRRYTGWHLAPLRLVLRTGLALRSWWVTR